MSPTLRRVPDYSTADSGQSGDEGPQQDFDMHGTDCFTDLLGRKRCGYGGTGGYEVDIAGNTFLGHAVWQISHPRPNFELRGYPCVKFDFFRDNVTRQSRDNTIFRHNIDGTVNQQGPDIPSTPVTVPPPPMPCDTCGPPARVLAVHNQYIDSSSDPTSGWVYHPFGVGDFDGDGDQDLFYATGAAWYYSPGGRAEWRFLSAKPDKLDSLLLGDFDGDGITDVVAKRGAALWVSWRGISNWEQLNSEPSLARVSITDLAVGKFLDHPVGDHRDDIFLADGTTWFLSSGGSGSFDPVNTSHKRVSDLRFGDFDGDGKTDVFGVVLFGPDDWRWAFSKSAQGAWADGVLRSAFRDTDGNLVTVDNLVVADFDGNGRADVATSYREDWMVSFDGVGDWTHHNMPRTDSCPYFEAALPWMPATGFFTGNRGVDVLVWNGVAADTPASILGPQGNEFCFAAGGNADGQVGWTAGLQSGFSRQDMR
jgi:VCBS repeat protein